MWKILGVFDICDPEIPIPGVLNLPWEGLQRGSALEVSTIKQHVDGSAHAESLAPAPVMVCYRFTTSTPPFADHLHNAGSVSVIYRRMSEVTSLTWT